MKTDETQNLKDYQIDKMDILIDKIDILISETIKMRMKIEKMCGEADLTYELPDIKTTSQDEKE